jgi:hypothetical protein
MNHPVALEMILQYVSEIEICISFQQISLDTYITALNSMQYPHTFPIK